MKINSKQIICALDFDDFSKAANFIKAVDYDIVYKVGMEFFYRFGIEGIRKIRKVKKDLKLFLDLKLHDIPNTVSKGIKAIEKLKPLLTTIHISGGDEMMRASIIERKKTKILGVSVLTSLDSRQTKKYYNEKNIKNLVKKFVKQARKLGLDGIVCSPKEIKYVRQETGKNFLIVTPGIRINKSEQKKDDQKRVLSPIEAIKLGANLIVIGRPITKSNNPLESLKKINKSLA